MTDIEFAAVVAETKKTVLASVRRHLAARFFHAIDDVVQETYFRGYRHLSQGFFRDQASLSTWLYTIARNESLRMNKKLAREEDKRRRSAGIRDVESRVAEPDEDETRLAGFIGELPDKYRRVMEHKLQGMTEKEIAGKLGIEEGTVKSRFSRGKKMLKKHFGEVS